MPPARPPRPADDEVGPDDALPALGETPNEPIALRPDGYHWQSADGRQEFGPFASYEDAWADMHAADVDAPEPGETVQEAESEIGVADCIHPDTGEPAEGLSTPRLDND